MVRHQWMEVSVNAIGADGPCEKGKQLRHVPNARQEKYVPNHNQRVPVGWQGVRCESMRKEASKTKASTVVGGRGACFVSPD